MMKELSAFDIAGRAMSAQLVRLNTIASNLANAETVSGTEAGAYRAMKPVFATQYAGATATVNVTGIVHTGTPERQHQPDHPLADADGNVWAAGVDPNQELVEMVETARQYANTVEVLSTAKTLALDTLRLGR
ncbi:MAG: flagellar basal body rod protein FlgC [Polymorphobacter sp.]|uniref:flagellar basal body rod protein FlgC n=1 Tax=Polymorphobacter sp. TaxID=1909290 RepID=UPI003A882B7A